MGHSMLSQRRGIVEYFAASKHMASLDPVSVIFIVVSFILFWRGAYPSMMRWGRFLSAMMLWLIFTTFLMLDISNRLDLEAMSVLVFLFLLYDFLFGINEPSFR